MDKRSQHDRNQRREKAVISGSHQKTYTSHDMASLIDKDIKRIKGGNDAVIKYLIESYFSLMCKDIVLNRLVRYLGRSNDPLYKEMKMFLDKDNVAAFEKMIS